MWLIEFNNDALAWTAYDELNITFLKHQFDYFKEKLEHHGYLYINDIYECLGIEWNPNVANFCFRDFDELRFNVVKVDEAYELTYLIEIICPRLEAL